MLLDVLKKIRYMNDTEFSMLCGLLGLNDAAGAQNQAGAAGVSSAPSVSSAPAGQGVSTVKVTAAPSAMYPMNNGAPVYGAPAGSNVAPVGSNVAGVQNQVVAQNTAGSHQKKATWHNLPIVNDVNFETEKSFAHVFQYNNLVYCLFIARTNARIYNNVLKYGIMEESFYTIYQITDNQNKQKTQLQPITGKDLAAMLGV